MGNYKRLFLAGHSYYITIVTHRREAILVDNIALLRESFQESKYYYKYNIDAIVILPDHIHMIITPENANEYPKIIHAIKYNFSKRYHPNEHIIQSSSRYKRQMRSIWQKRYYEHTIRNEKDYLRCLEYIQNNPIKHNYIENGEAWEYLFVP
jgi:putative transposase